MSTNNDQDQPAAPAVTPAPAQGETPRTERPAEPHNRGENPEGWADVADWEADRADTLERELNEAKAELAELKNAGGPPFIRSEAIRNCREDIATLRQQLAAVEKQRDGWMEDARIRACNTDHANNKLAAAESELAALRQWSEQAREAMKSVIHFCDLPSARDRLTTLLATHPAIDSVMKQEGRE